MPAATAAGTVFRRVHPQGPSGELVAIELLDGCRCLLLAGELHKCESARPAAFTVGGKVNVANLARFGEQRLHLRFAGIEIEVTYEHF